MKNILTAMVLALFWSQTNAQYQALQIGEKMPDFEFSIQNYKTPIARISDFKGKLVFFDFWSTYCSTCIAGFPKMEKLQEEFGDKIIIILVNIRETQEEVDKRLKARKKTAPELERIPSIIGEAAFAQLFPHQFAGNYVWIDPKGVLRLNSSVSKNIHAKKIQEILDGKEITFLTTGKVYRLTDTNSTLIDIISESKQKATDVYSLFTSVNLDYYPIGGQLIDHKDSISNTIRNTYINRTFIELYLNALEKHLDGEWSSKVFGPNIGTNHYLDYFDILVKDSSIYERRLIPHDQQTDENITRSLYCYEQVLPQTVTKKQALGYMKEDLDRYFGMRYGCKVTVEEVEFPCYYLTKASNTTKLSEDEIKQRLKKINFQEFTIARSYNSLVSSYFRAVGDLPYVFLDTDLPMKFYGIVPNDEVWNKESKFQDFQYVLQFYNLKLVEGIKRINMIVVRD